ncbi:hypothetical protein E2C01_070034 [Portunus trituberculatus]|uniref:Uncharacterized protein n=1 Tax=Portunus trituberculatus TaxID=210409 RepID=A0A5B7HRM7_PORTR|nr:hypothetical protein [Portunus trituberculatus]
MRRAKFVFLADLPHPTPAPSSLAPSLPPSLALTAVNHRLFYSWPHKVASSSTTNQWAAFFTQAFFRGEVDI